MNHQADTPSALTTLVSSRYNFFVPSAVGAILYNAMSGAVLLLEGIDAEKLARSFGEAICRVEPSLLSDELLERLLLGGFLNAPQIDEIEEIKHRYWTARQDTPMVVTITTTQDCNLGCYYCYEERTPDRLSEKDLPAILELTERNLRRSGKKRLHIDWYGGEPLLNKDFIEMASPALQKLCATLGVGYQASVISNGTSWAEDVESFVNRHQIKQVQISFDGLQKNHDRRRRYRDGYLPQDESEKSSFARAVWLVDNLSNFTRVDLRFNTDRKNSKDILPFISFARKRGWFDRPYAVVFQPARLAAYSEHSSFIRKNELTLDEFDEIRKQVRDAAGSAITVEESEIPDGFPFPKTSVCAALAADSVVIGADTRHYRCGLQVGEQARAVGNLERSASKRELPVLNNNRNDDTEWWAEFDPTTLPKCSKCSFLPVCWAGCPKKHLEADEHAIAEQSRYWRQNLATSISRAVGIEISSDFAFEERHQFR